MRTMTTTSLLLASALPLAFGCDEAVEPGFAEGATSWRCVGTSCHGGGLGNTSRIGDHALSNMSMKIDNVADNYTAGIRILGGTQFARELDRDILEIEVEDDGELRLRLEEVGWVSGELVKGAVLDIEVIPHDVNESPFTGALLIADAECGPGRLDGTMTICTYALSTDVEPGDPEMYKVDELNLGYYHTCPDEDEQGNLNENYKYRSVLSPQVSLVIEDMEKPPQIADAPGIFINGCLNGAVSKGQYHLNAFYDSTAYRGLDPSQMSAMLLMWMAWFDGQPQTVPGLQISPHDPIGGLFTWTSASNWDIEAGYDDGGASCRGGSLQIGLHRYIIDPVLALGGWSALPRCDMSSLGTHAVLGVKVQADLW